MTLLPTANQSGCGERRCLGWLRVSAEGRIVASRGDFEAVGLPDAPPGSDARQAWIFLEGILPLGQPGADVMPQVQVGPETFADIHLFCDGELTWVALVDVTADVLYRRPRQQRSHETTLFLERREPLLRQLWASLDRVALESLPDGDFFVLSEAPPWFVDLVEPVEWRIEPAALEAAFPFLTAFWDAAEAHWDSGTETPLSSEPWTQGHRGRDLHLEAVCANVGSRRILLLEQLGARFVQQQRLLQFGRDKSLKLEQVSEEFEQRDLLAHCIVHDLTGQLTGAYGTLRLVEGSFEDTELRELAQLGIQQIQQIQSSIREILEVFRLEKAQRMEPAVPVDVAGVARSVVRSLDGAFRSAGLQLRLEMADPTPWVMAEQRRLERVLYNLLENALRYAPRHTAVTVRLAAHDGWLEASVEDEGPGVPVLDIPRLFQRMSQGARRSGKIGLGLYFCRLSVEGWGGRIEYRRRAAGGAVFAFVLPTATSSEIMPI